MSKQNKIVFFNILSTIVLQGVAFFAAPLFSRMLGTSNYGVVTVYATWVSIISAVFGLQTQSTLAVAQKDFSKEQQKEYQASCLLLSMSSFVLFSVTTYVVLFFMSKVISIKWGMVVCAFIHAFGTFSINFVNTKYTYEFKADYNFYLSLIVSIITVGLSILLVRVFPNRINYWGRILGQTIGYGFIAFVLANVIVFSGKTKHWKGYWRYCLPLAVPIVFHQISNLLLNQSDKIMLQRMCDNSVVGIYGLAGGFSIVMSYIWSALNNSWVPFYYEYTRNNQIEEIRQHSNNYLQLFSTLSIGFILLTPEVFHLFASNEYWGGTTLIPVLVVGYFFVFLYSFPVNYEFYNKKTKTIAVGTILATVVNFVLNYCFIMQLGALGAAVATAAAHLLQFLFHYIAAKRIRTETRYPFEFSDFVPYIVAVVGGTVAFYLFLDYWYIRWGGAIILGGLCLKKIIRRKALF